MTGQQHKNGDSDRERSVVRDQKENQIIWNIGSNRTKKKTQITIATRDF